MSVMFLTMRCQLDKNGDLSALRLPLSTLLCLSICLWLFVVAFIVFAAAASVAVAAAVAVWRGVYAPVCSAFCM